MASHLTVVNTALNRIKVAVTPGKYMIEVRDEVCAKSKAKTTNYDLKYKTKLLDLSQTFRQSGLPPGALLELVVASRSAGVVSVALQAPDDASRLTDKFPSDTTLWQILRKFEATEGKNLNFTARGVTEIQNGASAGAGRIFYEMPSLHILGRDCSTFGDLQKTLQQLGINNGSALLRLSFKKTEQPFEEAITEIGQYFKEEAAYELAVAEETDAAKAETAPEGEAVNITEAVARIESAEPSSSEDKESALISSEGTSQDPTPYPETVGDAPLPIGPAALGAKDSTSLATDTSEATSQDPTPYPETVEDTPLPITPSKRPAPSSSDTVTAPSQRLVEVYLPPSSSTPKAALAPHNEADYEPQVAHALSHQSGLTNRGQNKRLPSDVEIERQEQERVAKVAAMKELKIKIRLPDQSSADVTFSSTDNAADLYEGVRDLITFEKQPFKLVWTDNKGPRTVPRDEKRQLVRDLGFSPRQLVNFIWEDGASSDAKKAPALKPEYRQLAKEITVPEVAAVDSKENGGPNDDKGKGKEGEGGGRKKGGGLRANLLKHLGGKK